MDINEEYYAKKEINKLLCEELDRNMEKIIDISKGEYSALIAYPLSALEHQYKVNSEASVLMGLSAMELLILNNPLRQAIFWFVKEILKRKPELHAREVYYNFSDREFGNSVCDAVLRLHEEYLNLQRLDINRGISKVKFTKTENDTYEILFPTIKEKYVKEMLYYYGLDDASSNEKELEKVVKVDKYLFSIFDIDNLIKYPGRLLEYLDRIENMFIVLDAKLYRLCKTRVAVDINKIAEDIESDVIHGKSELISIVALFYYMSRLFMQKNSLNAVNPLLGGENINYCDFNMSNIINLGRQVGICEETLKRYIEYFSIDCEIEKGGFTEFPFIVLDNHVIWLPSSFMLNDFQFSIVNGHYYKKINFPKHEETIAKSIVDYIINNISLYSNVICANNYVYSVEAVKFNGKDLQSDIDVALYDVINNVMIIIECKWKENVYTYTDDFVRIERAVNEVYKKQLDKHKFFFGLDNQNYEKVFDGKIDLTDKIEYMEVFYLFVDKRIQFHNQEENYHVVPTFMLAYLFKKYQEKDILNLRKVIDDIKEKNTEVTYKRKPLTKSLFINDKIFE